MAKRLFDIFASIIGLIILLPVLIIIALVIRINMKKPVFYCQERIGKNGQPFIIYKFRTMVLDHQGDTITLSGEKRITSLGSKLRRYKLDELPELWNILKGDMSFVGPRPDVSEYVNQLTDQEKIIIKIRPGLTSTASLKYYNEEEIVASQPDPQRYYKEIIWPDKVRMNIDYCKTRTFFGDLRIILKTILQI